MSNDRNKTDAPAADVLISDGANIRTIRFNRPGKKNAITSAMYVAMTTALDEARANDAIRCIVIAGTPGAFSAGNDLDDFVAMCRAQTGLSQEARDFLFAIASNAKPVVAAVTGVAVGVGATMLLHCDYIVASEDARFLAPFVKLGIVPEAGSTLLLPEAVGHARAFEFLVMGRALRAEQALRMGIVNEIAGREGLDARAYAAASEIAALPPTAVLTSRDLLRGPREHVIARVQEEIDHIDRFLKVPDALRTFEALVSQPRS